MDKIILVMLMMKKLTIYEMRSFIEGNFTSICSSSMESVQSAIKKLLEKHMVIFKEFVENGVNKKVYQITDNGKQFFMSWVKTSMLSGKNMKQSKLFFLGFVPKEDRVDLINSYITDLQKEKNFLECKFHHSTLKKGN